MSNIKQKRLQAKLTQSAMSEKLKIPKRTIENWESGKSKPPEYVERLIIAELERLAKENK